MSDTVKIRIVSTVLLWCGSFLITFTGIDKMSPQAKWTAALLVLINVIVDAGGTVVIWALIYLTHSGHSVRLASLW